MPGAFGNSFMKAMINSPLHPLLGSGFAVITVTGRKTGQAISTPINVSPVEGGYTVTSLRERAWWRNLRGDAPASLRVGGKTIAVRGQIIDDPDEVREELIRHFQRNPGRAKYFNVREMPEGGFDPGDLQRAAGERLIIRLHPVPSSN